MPKINDILKQQKDKGSNRLATFDADSTNTEDRTVSLALSSEAPAQQWFGTEILEHGEQSIDLGRLKDGAPLLMDHNHTDQIGVIESVSLDADRVVRVVVRFGKSARAEEIFNDVKGGIRTKVSVGYSINEMVEDESSSEENPIYRVTSWTPYEASIVSIPADNGVGIGRSGKTLNNLERNNMPQEITEVVAPAAAPKVEMGLDYDGMRKAELTRITEMTAIGQKRGMTDLANEFIANGKSLDSFRTAVLDKTPLVTAAPSADDALIGLSANESRSFSFIRALNALANPSNAAAQKAASFEMECSNAVAARMGKEATGLYVPMDVMARDLTVAGSAGNTVQTDVLSGSFIETLENAMVTQQLGATVMRDLQGNVAIPRMTGGATGYWVAENGDITEGDQTFDQVTLSPKTVGAMTEISRKTLLQSSVGIEQMVRNDLALRLALQIDDKAINGDGTGNTPTGIINTTGIGAVTFAAIGAPTFGEVIDVETAVAVDNALMGNLSYLTSAAVCGNMKQTAKDSGSGRFIIEDGMANGYGVALSNAVTANSLVFGNWADLLIGFWGGLDLNIDTSTGSASGRVRIVALQDVDVAVRHAQSFSLGNGGV